MTDLDALLRRWADPEPVVNDWSAEQALDVARRVAAECGLRVSWEPPDEEWILFVGAGASHGMLSVRYPIALGTAPVTAALGVADRRVAVVRIEDFMAEDLRASPELLKATVLDYGWDDSFDTEAFSANDLFVESV
jgi:hypothetical protein